MKKITFSDIPKGFEDASIEAEYAPENLTHGFYDFNNYMERLNDINSPTSIIIGRKGVGKTAYLTKINLKYKETSKIVDMGQIPYYRFSKIQGIKNSKNFGGLRYLDIWKILIIAQSMKLIKEPYITEGNSEIKKIKKILEKMGLGQNSNLVKDIQTISNNKLSLKIKGISAEFSKSTQKNGAIEGISDLCFYLMDLFSKVSLSENTYILLDGVDDIMRTNVNQSEVLGALLRAIKDLNIHFKKMNINLKVILAIREDIINTINDPDINKVISSMSINLDWYTSGENLNLVKLMNKRMSTSQKLREFMGEENESLILWNHFFPDVISSNVSKNHEISSWNFFLEHTLYRPRDIIHFLKQVSDNYPNNESIYYSDFRTELSTFSQSFFFDEMKNELSGFVDEELISNIERAFPILGKNGFKYQAFVNAFTEINSKFSEDAIKTLLYRMFNEGYIGQRLNANSPYIFKHKSPRAKLSLDSQMVFHRGLYGAMNISEGK
ncbi:hypothetical protein [Lactobacillus sp. ESL0703]|uniref:P-loop ATPase, Sll1717 family n=1 Tax=Lactobacillus sp. ESL0703 TaxID=2983218 RepID=UPI0023F725EC|nr:hypothetical protein [Lactobacillus sp. ESL0703]MDF7668136.1 hypothetical protein [Lactobacillus sp. ESL0703]